MLLFEKWIDLSDIKESIAYINKESTENRIKEGLSMLQSISLRCHSKDDNRLSQLLFKKIVDIIGNKLISLHMDDMVNNNDICKMRQTFLSHPCTKDSLDQFANKSWFPINITHLCLNCNNSLLYTNSDHLWHYINKYTFPNLKHLKIDNLLDNSNIEYILMIIVI